jgi:hypothetical protein
VHYEGYDAKWDEWIEHGSERLRLPAGAAVGAALAEEAAGGGGGGGAAAAAIAFAPAPAVVSFVEMFLGMFTAARGQGAQERAGVFEIWQMFEMEHDAAPGHIVDAAQLLLRQPGFLGMLTRENAEFLRDAAGVLMRVHGMLLDGNFVPAPETAGACQRLGAAVERLVAQFEGESPAKTGARRCVGAAAGGGGGVQVVACARSSDTRKLTTENPSFSAPLPPPRALVLLRQMATTWVRFTCRW